MSFKILLADDLEAQGVAIFEKSGEAQVDNKSGIKRDDLLKIVGEYDALVVRSRTKVDAETIEAGRKLKVIGRAGIGVDNVDVKAATRAGIVVMNTPEGNATTTAEHALSLMLAMCRNIPQATASMRGGKWEKAKFMGVELMGKTLGVVGLGNIGRIVADRAQGLHLKVIAHDPFFDAQAAGRLGVELVTMEDLLRRSDIITVHTPLNAETKGLVGDAQIDMMKKGVMLVNCARGGIYDEAALLRGLNGGKIAAAALDVFVEEPPPKDHPLLLHERVICTPHLGASTTEAQVKVSVDIANQILEFAKGEPAKNAVNLPRVSAAELKQLGPWVSLAEKMGSFIAQLHEESLSSIEVTLAGDVAQQRSELLGTAVLAGALQHAFSRPVNAVNARILASERGISVKESRNLASARRTYASTVEVNIASSTGKRHTLLGAIFGNEEGRFVEVDGVPLEAVPDGVLLLIANKDRPGAVGHIGTVLGNAGINISRMHLGLDRAKGVALSLVNVDAEVPAAVIEKLSEGAIVSVRQVSL
jgi:D-3-phosphoglycerate dehydrogenase / 2-oxoglutarate reductase